MKAVQTTARLVEEDLAAADAAMARYAAGETLAFEVVYASLAPRLIAFLRRHARDEAAAQDAFQQTFLNIHRGRATFRPGSRVLPWALAIAKSVLREGWRRRPRLEVVDAGPAELGEVDGGAEVSGPVEARELADLAVGHLERLSSDQRLPYELVKLEGLSHAEAAQVMGTTVMTVKLRVHRVVSGLRSLLERTERA